MHKYNQPSQEFIKSDVKIKDGQNHVTLTMPDGSTYEGTVDKDTQQKHGYGTQMWPDNAKYVGEWKDGKAEGKGTFFHSNGDIFEGEFQNDKANGHGKYKHKSGQTYEGDWVDDL